jgi:hypothetical protein
MFFLLKKLCQEFITFIKVISKLLEKPYKINWIVAQLHKKIQLFTFRINKCSL